jgi:hypothetical protein
MDKHGNHGKHPQERRKASKSIEKHHKASKDVGMHEKHRKAWRGITKHRKAWKNMWRNMQKHRKAFSGLAVQRKGPSRVSFCTGQQSRLQKDQNTLKRFKQHNSWQNQSTGRL